MGRERGENCGRNVVVAPAPVRNKGPVTKTRGNARERGKRATMAARTNFPPDWAPPKRAIKVRASRWQLPLPEITAVPVQTTCPLRPVAVLLSNALAPVLHRDFLFLFPFPPENGPFCTETEVEQPFVQPHVVVVVVVGR